MDTWDEGQEPTGAGAERDAAGGGAAGGAGGDAAGGRPLGRPGQVRVLRWRAVGVLVRAGLLVAVFGLGHVVMGRLLGDPGPGPDPDIGGSVLVLAAVGLTAALGALRDSVRFGFRRAAADWTAAVALLAALGAADVLRGWLDDRAAAVGGGLAIGAADLVGPLAAIGIVAGAAVAVAVIGAALGDALRCRPFPS